ncbi:chloride channel [Podospora aff. communis PSN243]|uniref:Chloride channel protein n=1 Tax=Podospora aff. communis PSN243 TaxID=3040156 RepID=A0AAV9G819_9PEZI|nr:chloride channel [Podospora aff. communis PSN243]
MAPDPPPSEFTPLITHPRRPSHPYDADIESLHSRRSTLSHTHTLLPQIGERLPYNDYTTIDWLHDLVEDTARHRSLRESNPHSRGIQGLVSRAFVWWDAAQGWVAAFIIGVLTACVASVVDVSVATVADWKEGYCVAKPWMDRRSCCQGEEECAGWRWWATVGEGSVSAYVVYVGFALLFGVVAGTVTMATRTYLPSVAAEESEDGGKGKGEEFTENTVGKMMYMAAGSGIPEIKTILSGFVIPHFLDFKVLVVKAVGSTFAVATGMCLGKEGPFVHISTSIGYLVSRCFPKYCDSERKMREMLSVACSAGLSVAFGAPIGGVLFSYEEISTYFPRQVMWRSFLCSLAAAATLKWLNPTGTGKLVLFETNYGVDYEVSHYAVFVFLGVCGGLFGGIFCQANFRWSKFFRSLPLIKGNPVLEVFLVVLATALLQYPNRLIRDTGDIVMAELLVDCKDPDSSWLCKQEAELGGTGTYYAWLISGTVVKLFLTIITFGCKVPSGVIIPSLDAGALFGRMIGQLVPGISPGIFAMVGSAAFLAGVSRMTVSLAVVMFELTGEVNFIPPFMIAILTAKWTADAISADGVYDLSQHLLGHPFLDAEHALGRVRGLRLGDEWEGTMEDLIPPNDTMEAITLYTGPDFRARKSTLRSKLGKLKARGLLDAGLVLVNEHCICHGYLPQAELEYALGVLDEKWGADDEDVDLVGGVIAEFVNRSPLTVTAKAPVEYAVELFGKLGIRYLVVVEEETARVVGVVIKKRLVNYLDGLR